jgi:hypothetical protein
MSSLVERFHCEGIRSRIDQTTAVKRYHFRHPVRPAKDASLMKTSNVCVAFVVFIVIGLLTHGCGSSTSLVGTKTNCFGAALDCGCGQPLRSSGVVVAYQRELGCGCNEQGLTPSGFRCDGTLEQVLASPCQDFQSTQVIRGCGMVDVVNGDLTGEILTFSEVSGALIGIYDWGDVIPVPADLCRDSHVYGHVPLSWSADDMGCSCTEVTKTCLLCGSRDADDPPPCGAPTGAGPSGADAGTADGFSQPGCTCDKRSADQSLTFQPLACACGSQGAVGAFKAWGASDTDCTRNFAEEKAARCSEEGSILEVFRGCGIVQIVDRDNLGLSLAYDASTGALVGINVASYLGFGACTTGYQYGKGLFESESRVVHPEDVCQGVDSCIVCGSPDLGPPCDP